jgi:DegV family protein with EDD domain
VAVKIVSDSTADIPEQLADSLGVTIVPAYVLIDDVAYREGVDITRAEFYTRLQSSSRLPTTSQPTPTDFIQNLEPLVNEGHQVVCITLSRQLSGTYNSAIQAAGEFSDGMVSVIDSNTATAGHMLQVVAAAEDAARPDATAQSVTEAAAARAQRGFAYCALDTLEYLQKGGRIGAAQAFVGSLLKVKPILRVADGQVEPLERPRNMRRAVQRLEELIRGHGPASKLAVAYATDPAAADDLLSRLSDLVPADQSYTMQIGSAIGTHGGPGAIGVATLP